MGAGFFVFSHSLKAGRLTFLRRFLCSAALGDDLDGIGGDLGLVGLDERQVVGQVLEEEVFVLDLHRRTDMDLHGDNAFQRPAFFIQVNHLHRLHSINPMLVVIALN